MPNPVLRVVVAIIALVAALSMTGAGAGIAAAEPDDPGNVSEPDVGTESPTVSEPEPTTSSPPSIFDIPRTVANQLRDLVGKPLSIFGSGRVPGTHTAPDATTERKRDKPKVKKPEPPVLDPPTVPEPVEVFTPVQRSSNSSIDVVLPSTPMISVPVPDIPVPGYESMRWTLSLSGPNTAYASLEQTLATVNSLLADAYAPYNPFKPPPTKPTVRTVEEEPVVDAGGTRAASPLSAGTSDLTVLQAPILVPQVRIAASVPAPSLPPGSARPVAETGPDGVRGPTPRGPATQTGSTPVEQVPPSGSTSTTLANPALRDGDPQYLRTARANQLATMAIPGLAGLIAITVSGGVIGYRQVNSGRYLRSEAARFLQ